MKTLIFICLIAFTHAFTTEEILQKFDGNTNFGFNIELKDGSIIKDACFFTAKKIPNKDYQDRDEYIFIPREGMTCAIKKESIEKINIISVYGGKLLWLKNFDKLNSNLIKEENSYKIYNSKIFGKIKIKNRNNRNNNNKSTIILATNNKEIIRIKSSISIPSTIKNIKGLADFKIIESLYLSNSQVEDISALKGMKTLKYLNLSNSKVSDLKNLKGMQNLKWLNLSHSKVSDISALKDLPNLKWLNLSHSQVEDISVLKEIPSLEGLNLSNSKVSDIRGLKGMPNLILLNLSNSKVSDISSLKGMQNLIELYLSNSKVSDISSLKGMQNLSGLDISNNKVLDAKILAKIESLRYLNIINTKLVNFEEFPSSLQRLYLNQGNIDLTKILPKLNSIYFDFKNKNHLEQVIKSKIQKISFESFKGDFSFLKDLHACTSLNFKNTNFDTLSLLENQVKTLKVLYIKNCPIKDFSFLKNFKSLNVYLNVDKDTLLKLKKKYPNIRFDDKDDMEHIWRIYYS